MTKSTGVLAFVAAVVLHAALLLFGGLVFFTPKARAPVRDEVELIADARPEERKDEEKKAEKPEDEASDEAQDAVRAEIEALPDLRDLAALESPMAAPALAAMSLGDLESALGNAVADGEFGGGFSLASGGRIGGLGAPGDGPGFEEALVMADLDQRPRPILQASPHYPLDLRKMKVEGSVQVVFFVDRDGRVSSVQVERSTHPAFERPALEAVRQWRFEPGTRNGQKVTFKMRVPISFHVG